VQFFQNAESRTWLHDCLSSLQNTADRGDHRLILGDFFAQLFTAFPGQGIKARATFGFAGYKEPSSTVRTSPEVRLMDAAMP